MHNTATIHAAGPSALAGLIVMALLVPLNSCLLSRSKKINREVMAVTDTRVKAISEVISGIKVGGGRAWLYFADIFNIK